MEANTDTKSVVNNKLIDNLNDSEELTEVAENTEDETLYLGLYPFPE